MLFSSFEFILRFLPIFLILYIAAPAKYRNCLLVIGSLFFYGIGEPVYMFLLLLILVLNYGLYLLYQHNGYKFFFIISVILDAGVLFFFKYISFFTKGINILLGQNLLPVWNIALPLGISFYIFQLISFQADCYRQEQSEDVSFTSFAAYICMFPQLIAGPIVKFSEVEKQLEERKFQWSNLEEGGKLFAAGLALKVVLANQIGTLWNTIMTQGVTSLSAPVAWLGAIAYTFQIYFDFWGYSVMAMGLGQMLGFQIPVNFNNPYLSKSFSEFWRRWHITLGRWFKENVYIPLGGNREGRLRTARNLFLVWALTGLWHGASMNFILWGVLFFLLISLEKTGLGTYLEKSKILGHCYVILILPISWMLFAFTDFKQLGYYLCSMFGRYSSEVVVGMPQLVRYIKTYGILLLLCIFSTTGLPVKLYEKYNKKWYGTVLLILLLGFSLYEIYKGSNNPFLYFRF